MPKDRRATQGYVYAVNLQHSQEQTKSAYNQDFLSSHNHKRPNELSEGNQRKQNPDHHHHKQHKIGQQEMKKAVKVPQQQPKPLQQGPLA